MIPCHRQRTLIRHTKLCDSYLSDTKYSLIAPILSNLKAILKDRRQGKIEKTKNLASLFGITKKSDPVSYAVMAVLSGSTVKMCDLFGDDELKTVEKTIYLLQAAMKKTKKYTRPF